MINELAKQVHQNAKDHGFFNEPKNIGEMLCLIHSEVSEALEADRKGNYYRGSVYAVVGENGFPVLDDERFKMIFNSCGIKSSFQDELADIIIRVMDLAAFKNIDLEAHIKAKMRYNSLREYKHGKKY